METRYHRWQPILRGLAALILAVAFTAGIGIRAASADGPAGNTGTTLNDGNSNHNWNNNNWNWNNWNWRNNWNCNCNNWNNNWNNWNWWNNRNCNCNNWNNNWNWNWWNNRNCNWWGSWNCGNYYIQPITYPVYQPLYQPTYQIPYPSVYTPPYNPVYTTYPWQSYGPGWNNGWSWAQTQQTCQQYNQMVVGNSSLYNQYVAQICVSVNGNQITIQVNP